MSEKITVFYPGGFKPITGAHMILAERYADIQDTEVLMFIGTKSRDNISINESKEIFNLLNTRSNIKLIDSSPHATPLQAVYEYLFNLPFNATGKFAIAASSKDNDFARAEQFVQNVKKYQLFGDRNGRLIPSMIDAVILNTNTSPICESTNNPISGTSTRNAILNNNYDLFKESYPGYSDHIINSIWEIVTKKKFTIEKIDPSVAHTDEGSYQTIVNGDRGVGWFSLVKPEFLSQVLKDNLHYVHVPESEFNAYIVYNKDYKQDAIELLNIAKKYNGFLPACSPCTERHLSHYNADSIETLERDIYRIGQLLGYDDEKIFGHDKMKTEEINSDIIFESDINSVNWWISQLTSDVDSVFEGYETPKVHSKHQSKIKKLRKHLDKNVGKDFVYDFDTFAKTTAGVKLTDLNESLLIEGGAAGHMQHLYEDHGLTFKDMKELIQRAMSGRLDIEEPVVEKTDGQNIMVTWFNGQIGFARNKTTIKNPMTLKDLLSKFKGRGHVYNAFKEAGLDLKSALSKIPTNKLDEIFKNGKVFANVEIIYPATKNVISYDSSYIQFHNLVEFDENANRVQTDLSGGSLIQKMISNENANVQNTFTFIPPQKIKIGRVDNFDEHYNKLISKLTTLQKRFNLDDEDYLSDYHKAWWSTIIDKAANKIGYTISNDLKEILVDRWAFGDKSTSITKIKGMIDNEKFLNWVLSIDSKDLKDLKYDNLEPFRELFTELGVIVLSNVSTILAANPDKAIQDIRQNISNNLKALKSTNDPVQLQKAMKELKKINKLGGFDKIVPIEGLVFVFKGKTYKLTGMFSSINNLLGILKYSR